MIQALVESWNENKSKIEKEVKALVKRRSKGFDYFTYKDLLKAGLKHLSLNQWGTGCGHEIKTIDYGNYQGTLIFVFAEDTYQPSISETYYTYVEYGSCSGCDTLLNIQYRYSCVKENVDEVIDDLMTLLLHMIQRTKRLGEE